MTAGSDPLIPLFDIALDEGEIEAVAATLRSGWLTMGPRIREFEIAFAEHLDVEHAIATSSCTAALHLAYIAAGIGPGDEVIVPAITFVASAAAVRYCGATPVFADVIGPDDLNVDPADVEARITPATKAICAVHYAGYSADLVALQAICERHGLALIEDAAHAPSATGGAEGRKLGTQSLAGCFSFFSNKVLSCGEGGLLATDDERVAELVRSRRSHAMTSGTWDRHRGHSAGYDVVGVGYNYRMDEPRAALLSARLPKLETDIARRRELVHRYRERLSGVEGISIPFTDVAVDTSSCYVMPLMLEDGAHRAELRESMVAAGVQTSVLYPAIHEFTAYADGHQPSLPRSEEVARRELTLPLFPTLTERDLDRVVAALLGGLEAPPGAGMAAGEGVSGRGDG
jgi:dTDP-4-amino-4,6-dideoxygalactose transaminase